MCIKIEYNALYKRNLNNLVLFKFFSDKKRYIEYHIVYYPIYVYLFFICSKIKKI